LDLFEEIEEETSKSLKGKDIASNIFLQSVQTTTATTTTKTAQQPKALDEFGRDSNFYQISLRRTRREEHKVGFFSQTSEQSN